MRRIIFFMILLTLILPSCGGRKDTVVDKPPMLRRSRDIHIFYYCWYGTPEIDSDWYGWDSPRYLPTGKEVSYRGGDDIASSFYPAYGCYSSNDPEIVDYHMAQIAATQTGVICISWWGKDSFSDAAVEGILRAAEKSGIKACFHIEPFKGRTALATREAIEYILQRYGQHEAFYRTDRFGEIPMFYIASSSLIPVSEWAEILSPEGSRTIRNSQLDALVIGLWEEEGDGELLLNGNFDGFYNRRGSNGPTFASDPDNWPMLAQWSWDNDMIFIPCIAPGYDDTRIRPLNRANTVERRDGEYLSEVMGNAIRISPSFMCVDSFNDWHNGTQIELAIPFEIDGYRYMDYGQRPSSYYLGKIKESIYRFAK
ncbi:MAG: alpha-mannosidase [Candidatus Krumholzibacteriota bacterium]|nr:alpha-mannosidase [Candidatus Krumholzibacteriota bacterium]